MDPVVILILVLAAVLLSAVVVLVVKKQKTPLPPAPSEPKIEPKVEAPAAPPPKAGLFQKVSRTRESLLGKVGSYLGLSASSLSDKQLEEIEEALLAGDVGVSTTNLLLTRLKDRAKTSNGSNLRDLILEEGQHLLGGLPHGAKDLASAPKPFVISVVGVNGVGKTTTIGKLAKRFREENRSVLLGAGDTFRAAAISQLKVWADRVGADFVTGREGADPGAVAFDALSAAVARKIDVVLLDTAGRLHTKSNLMEELKKIHRVMKKVIPEAPHETWLVVDGTLGQNSLQQAREFQKALELTGIVVTKLDGTAKGGALLAIASELRVPIRYIGLGEAAEDLVAFDPKPYMEAILGA